MIDNGISFWTPQAQAASQLSNQDSTNTFAGALVYVWASAAKPVFDAAECAKGNGCGGLRSDVNPVNWAIGLWDTGASITGNLIHGHPGPALGTLLGMVMLGGDDPAADITRTTSGASAAAAGSGACGVLRASSEAAMRAADNLGAIFIKNKHLSSSIGRWAKFDSTDVGEVQGWVSEALRSEGAVFRPNSLADTFKVEVNMGRAIGTRGETGIRVIVTNDGRVINAFPFNVGWLS